MGFIRFVLDDGTSVLVESAEEGGLVQQYGGGDGDSVDGGPLGQKLASAAATAQALARTFRERLSPDELTLELGLKVSGQAQWFVAKAQTEGTVKVTAKWRQPSVAASTDAQTAPAGGSDTTGTVSGEGPGASPS